MSHRDDEEDLSSFLLIENQVKKQNMQQADDLLSDVIGNPVWMAD